MRWSYYNDSFSGTPLMAACLPTYKKASPSAKLAPLASSQSAPAIVGFEGFAGFEGFESLEFDDMSVGSLPSVGSSVLGGRISLGSMG